mmetsp:Transcript_124763/g.353186  ORF Transcript_124763/g.353186 Transcript_124763/m.353186 type:complete len:225 (+) Transcript_124763:85-759(+)
MNTTNLNIFSMDLRQCEVMLEQAAVSTPDILIKPTYDKTREMHQAVREMLADAKESPDVGATPAQEESIQLLEREIGHLISELSVELGSQPWHNPPSLRKLRENGEALQRKITDLRKQRKAVYPVKYVSAGQWKGPQARVAGGSNTAGKGGAGGRVTVEEALQMVLDKKTVQYRGGLIGIVHAAGVLQDGLIVPNIQKAGEMFSKVYGAKAHGAWQLHCAMAAL